MENVIEWLKRQTEAVAIKKSDQYSTCVTVLCPGASESDVQYFLQEVQWADNLPMPVLASSLPDWVWEDTNDCQVTIIGKSAKLDAIMRPALVAANARSYQEVTRNREEASRLASSLPLPLLKAAESTAVVHGAVAIEEEPHALFLTSTAANAAVLKALPEAESRRVYALAKLIGHKTRYLVEEDYCHHGLWCSWVSMVAQAAGLSPAAVGLLFVAAAQAISSYKPDWAFGHEEALEA